MLTCRFVDEEVQQLLDSFIVAASLLGYGCKLEEGFVSQSLFFELIDLELQFFIKPFTNEIEKISMHWVFADFANSDTIENHKKLLNDLFDKFIY